MAGNGDQRVNPAAQQQALPPEFIQQAKQQAANTPLRNNIEDVAISMEAAAQSIEAIGDYANEYARRLRDGRATFLHTVHQMLGKIAK